MVSRHVRRDIVALYVNLTDLRAFMWKIRESFTDRAWEYFVNGLTSKQHFGVACSP